MGHKEPEMTYRQDKKHTAVSTLAGPGAVLHAAALLRPELRWGEGCNLLPINGKSPSEVKPECLGISDQEGISKATRSRACLEQPCSLSSPDASGLRAPWVFSRPRGRRVLPLLGDSSCSLGGWLMAF